MERFKNILVFAGTSDPATAIKRAFEIAEENEATVTLMDVIKPLPSAISLVTDAATPDELEHLLVEDRRQKLVELGKKFSPGDLEIHTYVASGDAANQIVQRVLDNEHDLVIKTADGLTAGGRLFGSTARSLLRICPCPVWLLKPQIHGEFDQVLCAIDVDADDEVHKKLNLDILDLAYSIAQRDNAHLHVVSVWELWMEQALRRRAGDAEVDAALVKRENKVKRDLDTLLQAPFANADDIEVHLRRGNAAHNIHSVVEEVQADLVVMGTVCRTGVAGFLIGNTAENLLSELSCSVLAIKPAGFVTPVRVEGANEIRMKGLGAIPLV